MALNKQSDSLISEFKDLIKQITVEVSKQSVVQEIKRSEETMKQSSSQMQPVAQRLGDSAVKLEQLLKTNSGDLIAINKRLTKIEVLVGEKAQAIIDKNETYNKQRRKELDESMSNLRNSILQVADKNHKEAQTLFQGITSDLEKEAARSRKARKWMFALLSVQLMLTLALPVAVYYLLLK